MNYGIMNMASIPNIHRWAYVVAILELLLWSPLLPLRNVVVFFFQYRFIFFTAFLSELLAQALFFQLQKQL